MGTYTWNIVIVANTFWQKPISDFPSKNRRTFSLVFWNTFHDAWSSHPRFGSADGTRLNRARFIVPEKIAIFAFFRKWVMGTFATSIRLHHRSRTAATVRLWRANAGSHRTKVLQKLPYLPRILDTHPLETWRIREISHGRAPEWANSMIFCRVESGKGRPLT